LTKYTENIVHQVGFIYKTQSDAMETNSLEPCYHSNEEQISDRHYDVMLYSRSNQSHDFYTRDCKNV